MNLKYYLRGLGIGVFVTAVIMGIASGKEQMTDEEVRLRARELGMVESTLLSDMANLTRPEQQEDIQDNTGTSGQPEETKPDASSEGTKPEETLPKETEPEEPSDGTKPEETLPEETKPEDSSSAGIKPEETEPEGASSAGTKPGDTPPEETKPDALPADGTEPENPPQQGGEPSEGENNGGNQETVTITINSGQSSVGVSKLLEDAGLVESAAEYDKYLCANGYDKKIRAGTYEIPAGADAELIARIITRSQNVSG